MKISRFLIRLIPVLLLWYVITFFLFNAAQGPHRRFALGNSYELVDFPGWIMRWKPTEEYQESLARYKLEPSMETYPSHWEHVTSKPYVTAFCVKGTWAVGKTENSWFVINTQKKEVHNPCSSLEEIRKISGINISEPDLITKYPTSEFWPSRYEVIQPAGKAVVIFTTAIFFTIAILAVIGFRRTGHYLLAPFIFLKKIFYYSAQKP